MDKTLESEASKLTQSLLKKNKEITTISFNGISKIELKRRSKTKKSLMKLKNSTWLRALKRNKKLSLDQITIKLEMANSNNKDQPLLNKKPRSLLKMSENSLELQLEFLLKTMASSIQ